MSGDRTAARALTAAEVAALYLPPEWSDRERWMRRRLNRGEIPGYKVGREWMMTEADVHAFIEQRRNTPASVAGAATPPAAAAVSIRDGLSARSRGRLREAS